MIYIFHVKVGFSIVSFITTRINILGVSWKSYSGTATDFGKKYLLDFLHRYRRFWNIWAIYILEFSVIPQDFRGYQQTRSDCLCCLSLFARPILISSWTKIIWESYKWHYWWALWFGRCSRPILWILWSRTLLPYGYVLIATARDEKSIRRFIVNWPRALLVLPSAHSRGFRWKETKCMDIRTCTLDPGHKNME